MSKTKEEIFTKISGAARASYQDVTFKCMDEWVNEFKEKLKAKLMADILFFEATELTDIDSGRLAGLKKAHNYIDEL